MLTALIIRAVFPKFNQPTATLSSLGNAAALQSAEASGASQRRAMPRVVSYANNAGVATPGSTAHRAAWPFFLSSAPCAVPLPSPSPRAARLVDGVLLQACVFVECGRGGVHQRRL